jgi:PAP2 superfamily
MEPTMKLRPFVLSAAALAAATAHADALTDWNVKCGEFITESKLGTPPAVRVMAIVQTAAYDAVSSAQQQKASAEAALAAAHRLTLAKLLPAQQAAIDAAYQTAVSAIADGAAKSSGITAGETAGNAVLAARADDGAVTPESLRPHTSAGVYVPTVMPAVPQWPQRKPWLMQSASQFRPGPPPALTSERWARDFNEVKAFGSRSSTQRSAEQTDAARFWEYSLPAIYHGVVRSALQQQQPQRGLLHDARLLATAAQAMDDALIATFDAKYHYNFWRPVTAVRNADIDGNDATQRDASWAPLFDTPMHPEYPSAHSSVAAALAAVLKADNAGAALPVLSTSSPTAKGAVRKWTRLEDFVKEVSDARVHAGIHYRGATDAGEALGTRVGELAAARLLQGAPQ